MQFSKITLRLIIADWLESEIKPIFYFTSCFDKRISDDEEVCVLKTRSKTEDHRVSEVESQVTFKSGVQQM